MIDRPADEIPLPVVDAGEPVEAMFQGSPRLVADATGQRPRRRSTVLLATARHSLVNWFQVALAATGLSLSVSPDGLHALMSAVRQPPELVILDDDLPGVDADQVEELLARDARTARTRIMHVTSPPDNPESGAASG